MKKFLLFMLLAFIAVSCTKVPQGYVGVKVNLLGDKKGVDDQVLGVGRYWIGWNEELYKFPTYQINYVYTAATDEGSPSNEEFTFQTKEGMECSVDLGVAMHFEKESISTMFQTYRKGVDEIRAVVVRNSIRDALNRISGIMVVEYVYGEGKSFLLDTLYKSVKASLATTGIIIDKIYLIGSIRIPKSIKDALDAKVAMTQEAMATQNEVLKETAKANIAIAKAKGTAEAVLINARAQAEANRLLSQSLTETLVKYRTIEKWDGTLPIYTGGPVPLINISK